MILKLPTILILLYSLLEVGSTCHTCQSNYAVCHDDMHFTMCTDGISTEEMQTCPIGYVCTGETEICLQSSVSNPVQPTCEKACGLCNSSGKLFACLDETTYAYCFGVDVPDYSAAGVCPEGYVCNLGSLQVCVAATEVYPSCYDGASHAPTTLSPPTPVGTTGNSVVTTDPSETSSVSQSSPAGTTDVSSSNPATIDKTTEPSNIATDDFTTLTTDQSTSTESRTSTPSDTMYTSTIATTLSTLPPRDETAFCRDKQRGGYYKAENDPTCQEFILCYLLSGQLLGIKYTCSGSYYFNDDSKSCQFEKPTNC